MHITSINLFFLIFLFYEINRDNTYEPEDNLNCPEILQAFLENHERENNKNKDKDKYERIEAKSSSKKHKNKRKQQTPVRFILTNDMTDFNEEDESSNKKNNKGKDKEKIPEANRERDTTKNKGKGKESEALQGKSNDSGYANQQQQQQRRSQDEQDIQQSKKTYSNQFSSTHKSNNIPAKVSCVFFLLLQTFLISYLFFIFNN